VDAVRGRQLLEAPRRVGLTESAWNVERRLPAQVLRNVRNQVVERSQTDRRQHRGDVGLGVRDVAHHEDRRRRRSSSSSFSSSSSVSSSSGSSSSSASPSSSTYSLYSCADIRCSTSEVSLISTRISHASP